MYVPSLSAQYISAQSEQLICLPKSRVSLNYVFNCEQIFLFLAYLPYFEKME
jgi:hypothetical protein